MHGYTSEPIQVVAMPDGKLTSLDNRRLWGAQEAGLSQIPAVLVDPSAVPPAHLRNFLRLDEAMVDKFGEVGIPGAALFQAGTEPQTMVEAVMFRGHRQRILEIDVDARLFGSETQPLRDPTPKQPEVTRDLGSPGPGQVSRATEKRADPGIGKTSQPKRRSRQSGRLERGGQGR